MSSRRITRATDGRFAAGAAWDERSSPTTTFETGKNGAADAESSQLDEIKKERFARLLEAYLEKGIPSH
jgi:hypothetical protein